MDSKNITENPEASKERSLEYARKLLTIGKQFRQALDMHSANGCENLDADHQNFVFNKECRQIFESVYSQLSSLQKERGEDPDKRNDKFFFESGSNENKKPEYSSSEVCAICCSGYKIGQMNIVLYCDHKFHYRCIKSWEEKKNECPICKTRFEI